MRNDPGEQEARKRMGANIQERRESLGLSRRELADQSGLTLATISALERGKRWPELLTVKLLCKALRFNASSFFDGIRREPRRGRTGRGVWVVEPVKAESR
jgi:transcriptional regulator with XRE-family HTH domain